MRASFLYAGTLLALALRIECIFWPRSVQPNYYLVSDSTSSYPGRYPSGIQSGNSYQYDWNNYNQNYPQTSVLYPGGSQDPNYIVPSTNGGFGSSGLMSGLFQKPWLSWKFSKLGLQSPGSSPCVPHRPRPSFSMPSLSSLFRWPSSVSTSPCLPTTTTICCTTTDLTGSSRGGNYLQTYVSPNRHHSTSSSSYPSSNYGYTGQSPSSSSSSSGSGSTGYSSQSNPSSYSPQASELSEVYDFDSSK